MNGVAVDAVPPAFESSMRPVKAPFGTSTRTSVPLELFTSAGTLAPLLPAKVTEGSLASTLRLEPVSVTCVPGTPRFGLKSEITGAGKLLTTKSLGAVAVPPSVSTVNGPVAASAGTTTVTTVCVACVTEPNVVPPPVFVKRTTFCSGPRASKRAP